MLTAISKWLEARRTLRLLRRQDARLLLARNPAAAYYDAQRLAARAWFAGDRRGFMHWAHVAAEVARISDYPMDVNAVRSIVDEEERAAMAGASLAKPP
jgi:hypothetical protein